MNSNKVIAQVMLGLALIGLVVGPWIVVWALNTLFGLALGYTWETWLAVVILGIFLQANVQIKQKGKNG